MDGCIIDDRRVPGKLQTERSLDSDLHNVEVVGQWRERVHGTSRSTFFMTISLATINILLGNVAHRQAE